MSIWGKLVGGAAGFALGGPLGALLGTVVGHAVDRYQESSEATGAPVGNGLRRQAFVIAVIVLGAKMAKADGVVTRDEVDTFKRVFEVPAESVHAVAAIFNRAKADAEGFEPYARQIAAMFAGQPAVLEELLDSLFLIAMADGVMHEAELGYLRQVCALFGLSDRVFDRLRATHVGISGGELDPYAVLGVEPGADDGEVKSTYRRLVREHHPDRLIAEGMPEEFVEVANQRLAAINTAYDRIRRERGMR